MANQYFQFKQFTVYQDCCAMKVGADGVTLGAWADVNNAQEVLDVGCGTGLLALMVAQRNVRSSITAIEIDINCVKQAFGNCNQSPFCNRIDVHHIALQKFTEVSNQKFDLIISNPPYFNQSLKSPNHSRNIARHADALPHADLITAAKKLLKQSGRLCLILPILEGKAFISLAEKNSLFCTKKVSVFPNTKKAANRMLLEFRCVFSDTETYNIVVEKERGIYTEEYTDWVREFYLAL